MTIALDGEVALYCGERGDVLFTLKRCVEAISDYERCIALDPADEIVAGAHDICKIMLESGPVEDAR